MGNNNYSCIDIATYIEINGLPKRGSSLLKLPPLWNVKYRELYSPITLQIV